MATPPQPDKKTAPHRKKRPAQPAPKKAADKRGAQPAPAGGKASPPSRRRAKAGQPPPGPKHSGGRPAPETRQKQTARPEKPPVDWAKAVKVVYWDRDLVVVDKPAGLSTVRHPEEMEQARRAQLPPTLDQLVATLLKKLEGPRAAKGRPRPVRVVQRLDIGTSGLLVFARTLPAERGLAQQFRGHTIHRRYLALALGRLAAPLRIESLLVDNRGDGLRGSHPSRGKRAVTHVKPLEPLDGCSLVECRLETGRTHQIRIHLAEKGHPLVGEKVYNKTKGAAPPPDPFGAQRVMLHAAELGFTHPTQRTAMRFEAELPEDFAALLEKLRGAAAP